MKHPNYNLIFPGQGAQSVGMLAAWQTNPIVQTTLCEASDALGYDMARLIGEDSDNQLNHTEYTQPALLAAHIAIWRAARGQGLGLPCAAAGHSLGEYTALVAAESIDFADALRLVRLRGQLMQSAVPQGVGAMMALVGSVDWAMAEKLCAASIDAFMAENPSAAMPILVAANDNAPGQVVLAGHATVMNYAEKLGKSHGAKITKKLDVSVPSHSPLMRDIADKFAENLQQIAIQQPLFPVLSNVTGDRHSADAHAIRTQLAAQLYSPVRWVACVEQLAKHSDVFLECANGQVVSGLVKRIAKNTQLFQAGTPELLNTFLTTNPADSQ